MSQPRTTGSAPNLAGSAPNAAQLIAATHRVAGPDLTATQLYELLRLRVAIFVVEQNCPYQEIDGQDLLASTTHLWFADEHDAPTSSIRLLADPIGVRIGRVVTRADARGHALAGRLFAIALDRVGHLDSVLDAQAHLQDFYSRLGYEPRGEEFLEDDIPHITMVRPGSTKDAS